MAHHIALFDHPPSTVAGDRGVHSPETEAALTKASVKLVAIPACVATMDGAKVATTGLTGWNGGWAWVSSEVNLRHIALAKGG